jgi:hypothetical protein
MSEQPDIGERVLLLGPGPEWQEATVRSSVTSCNTCWVQVDLDDGDEAAFQLKDGQLWWREIRVDDWVGGVPIGVTNLGLRGTFTLLRMTPENLAKRQRDIDIAFVSDAVRGGVGTWAPDVLRRVAAALQDGTGS